MKFICKLMALIMVFFTLTACTNSKSIVDPTIDYDSVMSSIYIGESFASGRLYLESFEELLTDSEENREYPSNINFLGVSNYEVYSSSFDSVNEKYIGNAEEASKYFFKPFSEEQQRAGLYKINSENPVTQIGIGLSNYEIESIDTSRNGLVREYSEGEYSQAEKILESDALIEDDDRILAAMTIENTIIGAKEHFRIKLHESDVEIVLSEYFAIGFESAGEVYVIDVISNGERLGTMEKYNLDGPY